MKKQPHVVLRTTRSAGAGIDFATPGAAPAVIDPADLSVEVEEVAPSRMATLARDPGVLSIAPVMPMKLIRPVSTPATPSAGTVDWGITAVGAPSSPFDGNGVVVAVLDTGIDPTHPAFAGVTLVRKNFTTEGDNDLHGHGTHCAGTIFGRDTGGRRIGVARGVKKAVIGKVLAADGGSSETIASAIQWAVQEGAHVVSMSLGMDFPGFQALLVADGMPPELATSKALEGYRLNVLLFERLASFIRQLGSMVQSSVIIAAAGNESQTNVDPDFKIAVSPPAVSEGIISVAALGQSGAKLTVAPFSNTGAMVSGPGVGITSAKPGGGLATMSGTSMATPHVAGVAALWAQKMMVAGPLTPALLATRVVASGVTTNLAAGFDPNDVGSGLVQAPQS